MKLTILGDPIGVLFACFGRKQMALVDLLVVSYTRAQTPETELTKDRPTSTPKLRTVLTYT